MPITTKAWPSAHQPVNALPHVKTRHAIGLGTSLVSSSHSHVLRRGMLQYPSCYVTVKSLELKELLHQFPWSVAFASQLVVDLSANVTRKHNNTVQSLYIFINLTFAHSHQSFIGIFITVWSTCQVRKPLQQLLSLITATLPRCASIVQSHMKANC